MKRLLGVAAALAASVPVFAQQGPVVTARDDAPVAPTAEDAQSEAAAEAMADDGREAGRFYLGGGVGAMRVHRTGHPKPGSDLRGVQPYVVLRLGYDFADSPLAIEGFGMLGRAGRRAQGAGGSRALLGLGVEALWHFDRYARFDPFLAGGFAGNFQAHRVGGTGVVARQGRHLVFQAYHIFRSGSKAARAGDFQCGGRGARHARA